MAETLAEMMARKQKEQNMQNQGNSSVNTQTDSALALKADQIKETNEDPTASSDKLHPVAPKTDEENVHGQNHLQRTDRQTITAGVASTRSALGNTAVGLETLMEEQRAQNNLVAGMRRINRHVTPTEPPKGYFCFRSHKTAFNTPLKDGRVISAVNGFIVSNDEDVFEHLNDVAKRSGQIHLYEGPWAPKQS